MKVRIVHNKHIGDSANFNLPLRHSPDVISRRRRAPFRGVRLQARESPSSSVLSQVSYSPNFQISPTRGLMADLPAARKRLGDRFAHNAVDMCARVIADRLHFRRVGLAVRKRRFFNGAIENTSNDIAVIFVHNYSRYRSLEPASGTANSSFRNSSSLILPSLVTHSSAPFTSHE